MKSALNALLIVAVLTIFNNPWILEGGESENIVIVGGFVPVDTDEGLFTPLLYWDHKSKDYFLNGSLNINYETSTLSAKMEHSISDTGFYFGYGVTGTAISESLGSDIYKNGVRLEQSTYDGDSISGLISAGYRFMDNWNLRLQMQNKKTFFESNDDTGSSFNLPPEYTALIYSLKIRSENSLFTEKGFFEINIIEGEREDMENWSLDDDAADKKRYSKQTLAWEIPFDISEKNKGEITLKAGFGHNLDLLCDFKVGGVASEYKAGGFFRNEFRVKRVLSANYYHQYIFSEHRKLLLFADLVYFKTLDLDYLDGTDKEQTIGGIGLGFYYGIKSLKGLPIVIRYAEGINVDDASSESHRREVIVLIVAKF